MLADTYDLRVFFELSYSFRILNEVQQRTEGTLIAMSLSHGCC